MDDKTRGLVKLPGLGWVLLETLGEYLVSYEYLTDKVERLNGRIEVLVSDESYYKNVKKLCCLIGVKTHTALSVITEIGDFKRFSGAEKMAAYLGQVPVEDSSGGKQTKLGITKARNSHVRKLFVESAHSYTRGAIDHKSAELKNADKPVIPRG